MTPEQTTVSEFTIDHKDLSYGPVITGFARFGLAGLTAVDYLVDQLELEPVGYITSSEMPSITPVNAGRPRHPTRILTAPDADISVLMGELFVPPQMTGEFGRAILEWTEQGHVEELLSLAGVVMPQSPDDQIAWIATDGYTRLETASYPPVQDGFLDGILGALVEAGLSSEIAVGVLTTPVRPRVPDADAALALVEAVDDLYTLGIDSDPLRSFAQDIQAYYEELTEHLRRAGDSERQIPDDRMFM